MTVRVTIPFALADAPSCPSCGRVMPLAGKSGDSDVYSCEHCHVIVDVVKLCPSMQKPAGCNSGGLPTVLPFRPVVSGRRDFHRGRAT